MIFGGGAPAAWQSMAMSDPISTHTGDGMMVKKGRAGVVRGWGVHVCEGVGWGVCVCVRVGCVCVRG